MPNAWSSRARNLGAVAQYAPPHHDLMLGARLLAHLLGRRVRAEEEDAHGGCRLPSRGKKTPWGAGTRGSRERDLGTKALLSSNFSRGGGDNR